MSRHRRVIVAVLVGLVFVLSTPFTVRAADDNVVVIRSAGLQPSLVRTETDMRVTFVNRTGRPVHVEFSAVPAGHQVFQVPGQMWARFRVPGRHDYVVHVDEGGRPATLSGAVEVTRATGGGAAAAPVCDGTAASSDTTEVCIER